MRTSTLGVCTKLFVVLAAITLLAGNASAQFVQNHVSFTLEGCRNNGSITLPNGSGQFICPDAAYTTGNLGKGWNELDLVPHRLTTSSGSQADASTDYDVNLAADYNTGGKIGYDVLTLFQLDPNPALSDASCSIATVGANQFAGSAANPFGGGTDVVIFQQVHIHQAKGTQCVFDWVERLALGSHLYPGSSLQSYLATTADLSGSKKTVSIPVNQILPQSLSKDMNAQVAEQVNWDITKTPSKANLAFGNVCDQTLPLQQPVTITVDWTASQPVPNGPITVTTHVYATNPSARVITATVTDNIYLGLTGTTLLDTATSAATDLPANSTTLMLTHTFSDSDTTHTAYNDVATGTYVDKVTGVPIPGNTTATASTTVVSSGTTNGSATIDDVESISPATFTFSLDAFTGSGGYTGGSVTSPSGYVLGTQVPSLTWDSNSVSSSGEVVFSKTIAYNGTGGAGATGTLADTAEVKNGDQILAQAAATVIGVSSAPQVKLTINKTITPAPLADGAPPVTFTFHVKDGFNNEVSGSPFTLTFNPGDSTHTTGEISLAPSIYTISEDPVTGWITDAPHTVDLSANNANQCTGAAGFSNTEQGHIIVTKVTNPSSDTTTVFPFNTTGSGYDSFSLKGNGDSHDSGPLNPGAYSVAEDLSGVPGWDLTNSICDGTGNTPASITLAAGQTVHCTFTNSKPDANVVISPLNATNPVNKAHVFTITVTQIPNGDTPATTVSVTPSVTGTPAPSSQNTTCSASVPFSGNTATCTVTINSTAPATYTANATAVLTIGTVLLTRATGDANSGDSGPATKIYQAGQIKVIKQTNPSGSAQVFAFSPSYEGSFNLTDGQNNLSGFLAPGNTYSVAETVPSGWKQTSATCDNGSPSAINVVAGQTTTCTFVNTQQAKAKVIKTFNGGAIPPGACGVFNPCQFTFQLRQGASQSSAGTILETKSATAANGGVINFTSLLVPGQTYELCEQMQPGWLTTLGPPLFSVFNPGGDNSVVCTTFTPTAGQTVTFSIDNMPPPGGIALTIGYWKNWASCAGSKGKQAPVLDQTLYKATPPGISVGLVTLLGGTSPNSSPFCSEAVHILNKSTILGVKEAANPFYSLAAQLLAAELNQAAGAGVSANAACDINSAQNLLVAVGFNDSTVPTGTSSQRTTANALQTQLNNYNNNLPASCITYP